MSISKEELAKFGLSFGDGDVTITLKPGGSIKASKDGEELKIEASQEAELKVE